MRLQGISNLLNLGICIEQQGTWHFIRIFIIYTGILFLLLRCTYVDEEFAVAPIIVFFTCCFD